MTTTMLILLIVSLAFSSGLAGDTTNPPYECGPHGRFEYCIDGIPGCVVGCHCHPGYYFDTHSKICEPNAKLTEDYRRHYIREPTRVQVPLNRSPVESPTTVSSHAIDDKIDEITNDADDLGDWLYNQFFKTIENQVINKTENENVVQTRRSGSAPTLNKRTSRRSHKYRKTKKKKKKKKGLEDKLLRITEDDSLFDSSSSSSSSDDSSISSSSESRDRDYRFHKETRNKDHGHKKILVVNKRAKPPLPSFIFLPNMETPFFPPIGLPPPPMPMYPMVPVPPMMAPPPYPPYPYPALPHIHDDDDEATTTAHSTTAAHTTTTGESNTAHANDGTTSSAATTTSEPTTTGHTSAAGNHEETEVPKDEDENIEADTTAQLRSRPKHRNISRQKLMKKMREKMKRKNKLQNFFANEYQGLEPPFLDIDMPPEFIPSHSAVMPIIKDDVKDELPPGLRGIDFKYLTQLIHRGNLNKTKHNKMTVSNNPPPFVLKQVETDPPSPKRRHYFDTIYINEPNNYEHNEHNIESQPVRYEVSQQMIQNTLNKLPDKPVKNNSFNRRVNSMPVDAINNIYRQPVINNILNRPADNIQHRYRIEETNDAFFTKLGRQIASMVRNIEGNQEVDIQIEKSTPERTENSMFNGNNYRSRSYWERSVRSPYRYSMSFKSKMDKLKESNENLFSLENEVSLAASTVRTLSLRELENVISEIDKTKSNLIKKTMNGKPSVLSKTSFNVNLLPKNYQHSQNTANRKKPRNTDTVRIPYTFDIAERRSSKSLQQSTLQPELINVLLSNFPNLMPDIIDYNNITTDVKSKLTKKQPYQTSQPKPSRVQSKVLSYTNSNLWSQQTADINKNQNRINAAVYNQKNSHYVMNNNNKFINEKKALPIRYPIISNHYAGLGQRDAPSYFHSYSHFDYFD